MYSTCRTQNTNKIRSNRSRFPAAHKHHYRSRFCTSSHLHIIYVRCSPHHRHSYVFGCPKRIYTHVDYNKLMATSCWLAIGKFNLAYSTYLMYIYGACLRVLRCIVCIRPKMCVYVVCRKWIICTYNTHISIKHVLYVRDRVVSFVRTPGAGLSRQSASGKADCNYKQVLEVRFKGKLRKQTLTTKDQKRKERKHKLFIAGNIMLN